MAHAPQTDFLQDTIAVSLARAMAEANKRARSLGVDVQDRRIDVSQESTEQGLVWRINYGLKDYVGRRGGDLIVDVDPDDGSVKRVLHGQ